MRSPRILRAIGFLSILTAILSLSACDIFGDPNAIIRHINHSTAKVEDLSAEEIALAKEKLVIAYWYPNAGISTQAFGHQIWAGMQGMDAFYGDSGAYDVGDMDDASGRLRMGRIDGSLDIEAGQEGAWVSSTRVFLAANPQVNVVIWAWEDQLGQDMSDSTLNAYLFSMSALETEYPQVRFVYMTGHADGSGTAGNQCRWSRFIRNYCMTNSKYLYDFYDLDCYDPSNTYFGDKSVDSDCNYQKEGVGIRNWGVEWDPEGSKSWPVQCNTHNVNANQKARAAWNLWVNLVKSL